MARFGYNGPAEYEPLSAWQYFWLSVLFAVPVVGWVFLIIFSISRSNYNRRSFARSYWCAYIIVAIVCGVLALTGSLSAVITAIFK